MEQKNEWKVKDMVGQKFGRLTVIRRDENKHASRGAYWVCQCDCGKEHIASGVNLRRGQVLSCGCLKVDNGKKLGAGNVGSGRGKGSADSNHWNKREPRLYGVWSFMKERCYNDKVKQYKDYGGRGITVCDEWMEFKPFMEWALANGYDRDAPRGECTLDRIDNDGNYGPENCRWVNMSEQAKSRRKRQERC